MLIIRIDGAAVTFRASQDVARVLHEQSISVGCFLPSLEVAEGRALIEAGLPLLHDKRLVRCRQAQYE